jgi:hypothetical protein
LHAREYT